MTIVAFPRDTVGVNLQTQINTLTTAINNMGSALTKHAMSLQLDLLQRQLVGHYLDVGRITAASILSTL